ncbi:FliM/FliN family flagellar motor C-terminal domain-containing protein [Paracoccus onubensis]|uniref:FliM/FliN family flagellar motor C-terminal domain-containing protein n=1 Tax=Paracoccus onubensis TaxID=1675788 RepID=UPI0027319339|nr:FliM/FliN family flagellar motor C-terminal domain-containing protein [Paracoccus onubensis]MDP0925898.1 FliM/FliN family flagellar motor C-terminal domain-containing protein [Paracoccus onubensis]
MDGQDRENSGGVLQQLLLARNHSKAAHGRVPQLPLLPEQTPAQAAATAIGRTAETLYHLPVQTESVTLNGASLAEIPELLPEGALLMILQGKGEETGVMALCRQAVAALIEMQTCVRVTARPVPNRKLTRGDALMCAEFANSLLAELATELGGLDGYSDWGDFRYATFLDDPRPLQLILDDGLFRGLTCRLAFGQDQVRQSTIFLALPRAASQPVTPPDPEPVAEPRSGRSLQSLSGRGADLVSSDLVDSVRNVPVDLFAVLCRRKITLGELRSLTEGAIISLPRVTLSDVTLELISGEILARGKLGEAEGYHAIRLHDPAAIADDMAGSSSILPGVEPMSELMPEAISAALPVDLDAPNIFLADSGEDQERDMEEIAPMNTG